MKTLKDLFEVLAQAAEQNKRNHKTWFISFSGHVNKISISYHLTGWQPDQNGETLDETLNEDGIQSAYWFVKSRLN